MGCIQGTTKVQLSHGDDLDSILAIDPAKWTNEQVLIWLRDTDDGTLKELVPSFKEQCIHGVTFVNLTAETLKNELDIKALGLRDLFIAARDRVLLDHRRNEPESHKPSDQLNPSSNGASLGTVTAQSADVDVVSSDKKLISTTPNTMATNNTIDLQPPTQDPSDRGAPSPSPHSTYAHGAVAAPSMASRSPEDMESRPHQYSVDALGGPHALQVNKTLPSTVIHHPVPFHQQTSSNNHLITKPPSSLRHNHSFDDTSGSYHGGSRPGGDFSSQRISPQTAPPYMNGATPGGGGGGGYEEIQFGGSATNLNGNVNAVGFGGTMPPNAVYPEDGDEEDQYARIDFRDLNHSDPTVPGQQTYPNPMASVPFSNLTSSVHNVHAPGNGAPPTNGQGMHVKNQTGSNYDELPLEFISGIPNPGPGGQPQSAPNMNGINNMNAYNGGSNLDIIASAGSNNGGGYQEIEFNDEVDVVSTVPSQTSSFANMNGNVQMPMMSRTQLALNSNVRFFDVNMRQWVNAKVKNVNMQQNQVLVKLLDSSFTEMWLPMNEVQPILNNVNNHNPQHHTQMNPHQQQQMNRMNHQMNRPAMNNQDKNSGSTATDANTAVAAQMHVNGAQSPLTVKEKQIKEFARDLWRTLHKIEVKTIADEKNEPIRGFSGKELVRHVRKHLKKHIKEQGGDKHVVTKCEDLVKYRYIRMIAWPKQKEDGGDGDGKKEEDRKAEFCNSEKFLYQFENEKHREFIKDDQPDRRAWTRGTKIQIFSSTFGGWQSGTVGEVQGDTLTITYGSANQQMRKTLDRYQDDLVKSTDEFIKERKAWTKESEIEVYSHGQHIWCKGRIEEVLSAKENQPVDIFRVFYTNNDDKDFSKYVDRWSSDLREVQQLSDKLQKYKKGTKVTVWSNTKKNWVAGVVIDVMVDVEAVNVRYGDHEKLVPVSSPDIKLANSPESTDE